MPKLKWWSFKQEVTLALHNLVIHPLMGLLYLVGLKDLGDALHDASLETEEHR